MSEFVSLPEALHQQLAQENAPEAPQSEHHEAPAAPQPVVPDAENRFAKLSAASQRLQAERQAFADERRQFAAQQEEFAKWKQIIEAAKEDPVALAELAGYEAPDKYATALIEKGTLSPERRRILELEKQVQEDRNWRTEFEQKQQQAAAQQVQQNVMDHLTDFATQNAEAFPLVAATKGYNDVLGIIQQHYQSTVDPETGVGEVMPVEQAFEIYENHLDKQVKQLLELPQVKSRYAPAPVGPASMETLLPVPAPRKPTSPTLSSRNVRPQTGAVKPSTGPDFEKAGDYLQRILRGGR